MPIFNTKGFVLGSINLGETDKIVKFFTEKYGKVKGVVKGARRMKSRFSGSLQPLNFLDIIYYEKENQSLVRINSCEIAVSFHKVREDFEKLTKSLHLVELIDLVLKEKQRNKKVFDLLIHTVSSVELSSLEHVDTLLRIFDLRVLSLVGYKPLLDKCAACNRTLQEKPGYQFSSLQGGILCESCSQHKRDVVKISGGALNFMKKALVLDLNRVTRLRLSSELNSELKELINSYIEIHMGKSPKAHKFLEQ